MRWARCVALAAAGLLPGCGQPAPQPAASSAAAPVDAGPPRAAGELVDRAAQRGLAFNFRDDASRHKRLYETMGGGVVLFDADADGDLDVFLPGGGHAPGTPAQSTHQALFANDGAGRFTEVTAAAGLGVGEGAYALGGAAADVDGDGDLDLYVSCLGANRLYTNDGGGRFTEAPDAAGAADGGWSAAAVFFDADADGDPDLYVADYVVYEPADELPCTHGGARIYCTPDFYEPAHDRFYRNQGGRFVDATAAAGFAAAAGRGLAVAAADLDGDADLDLYVANDISPNFLWRNDGDGRFRDEALVRGVALGRDGQEKASMGVAVADLDGDGDLDLVVPNFSAETYDLFRQDEDGYFTEVAEYQGLAGPTTPLLGFGVVAADLDLDGWIDLAFASGHVNDLADELLVSQSFRQPNLLLRNRGGRFAAWPEREGDLARPNLARGLAAGDLDGDGDIDLVTSRIRQPAALFLSEGAPAGRWIAVRPLLRSGAPAVGARATLVLSDGAPRLAELVAGGSYGSQSEPVLRFGLAPGESPRELLLRWPSGRRSRQADPQVGILWVVREKI